MINYYIYIMDIKCKSSIFEKAQLFSESIKKISMIFIDPKYEEEFQKTKFEKKNILLMIGISIFFTMFMIGLRITEAPFRNLDDLGRRYPANPYAIFPLLFNIPLIFESIIFFISRLKILKGFFFNTIIMIGAVYHLNYASSVLAKNTVPLFLPYSFLYIIMAVIICFLYVANWICGALQITFIIGAFQYYMLTFEWDIHSRGNFSSLSISTGFCLILSIYYVEYFQRKSFFFRKQAEEQLKNLRAILKNLPDPIIISNKGEIEYQSQAYNEILNSNDSQSLSHEIENNQENDENSNQIRSENININGAIRQNPEELIEPSELLTNRMLNLNLRQVLAENLPLKAENFEIQADSFKPKFYEITSVELNFQGQEKMVYYFKDLTNFHKIKKLKERETFLRVYFASLTHDFRSPLGIIMGNTEMQMLMIHDEESLKNLRIIYNAGSILSLLVQDILDYSQIKAKTLRIAEIEFITRKEFEMIIELFHRKFLDKDLYLNLVIDKSVPEKLFNDNNRIKQVLMNLITNAFKFTVRGGVTVYVDAELNTELINVRVEDTGVGIKEEDQDKLFKEFGKLQSNQDLNPTGIGLGLHICKNIVKHLGGNIGFKSTHNIGTAFYFSFSNIRNNNSNDPKILKTNESKLIDQGNFSSRRLNSEINDSSIEIDKLNDSPTQKKLSFQEKRKFCNCPSLLIVDDDYGIRNIMASYCKRHSIKYEEAENGQKAIDKVTSKLNSDCCKYYKLILTDYYMPFLDGIKSSVIIKSKLKQYPGNDTKIILVSGLTNDDNNIINSLEENPFIQTESKPLSYQRFQELARSYL